MDVVGILASLNKIGLIAFLITLGFLGYEVWLLRKIGKDEVKPTVPQFTGEGKLLEPTPVIDQGPIKKSLKKNKLILIGLTVLLIFFAFISLTGFFNLRSSKAQSEQSQISPTSVPNRSPTLPRVTSTVPPVAVEISEAAETPTPAEVLLAEEPSPTGVQPEEEVTPTENVEESSPSPTVITRLPTTGTFHNFVILFIVSGVFLIFSLLF